MTRLAWLTDIHLNFLKPYQVDRFFDDVRTLEADALVITGDIGEGRSIAPYLKLLEINLQMPVYFVLGNHDYYYGSFKEIAGLVRETCRALPRLIWLDDAGVIELAPDTALIGYGGWADGRLGDYARSEVELLDYYLIYDFAGMGKTERLRTLNALGDAAAAYFRQTLTQALKHYRRVYAATHVPPFQEACWHEGQISNADFLPHFGSRAAGDALREVMAAHPDHELIVLCGHTHGAGQAHILPNLRVLTGGAVYGSPQVQLIFEIPSQ